jgi:hypothetical protein
MDIVNGAGASETHRRSIASADPIPAAASADDVICEEILLEAFSKGD